MMTDLENLQQDLDDYQALLNRIARLQADAATRHAELVPRAAIRVRSIMAALDMSADDVLLMESKAAKKAKKNPGYPNRAMPVRYRNQDGRTWSGIGRAPVWIADAPDRAVFLVN